MNNNFFTFLQEFYGSLSIPLLICAVIFFIGLTLLFWTLFISEGKKRTKLIKCLIFGGVSIAAYILLWYLYVSLFPEESGVRPNILSLIIVPATGCMMMAVVSLVLVLFKYRKNERAYLIPLSLFVVGLILIASKTFVYAFLNDSILDFFSSVFSLKFRSISPFELISLHPGNRSCDCFFPAAHLSLLRTFIQMIVAQQM